MSTAPPAGVDSIVSLRAPRRASTWRRSRATALGCGSALRAGTQLCAVVKADGYGHGAVQSARAALDGGAELAGGGERAGGAASCARPDSSDVPILVMGALRPGELAEALAASADVVVWSEQYVREVAAAGGGRVHVKLDSGMGRLGTRDAAVASRVLALGRADAKGSSRSG